ncbi:Kunitz/Bovine pancreatic trypsin inhibitor domain protein [Teladorsagia circumcincta]|uniref:Kunitz/Bovine pancreatic trypsin inhibitor domain protein n=1 Tax=Teladorsagia circumcincta TaxID=45464 RepID=A0A2G9UH62_TELCI|nr:Kunitz/Bovine pancreatic trypsin inhibitor domain protein [Teladorsagia circumcincta]
MFCNAGLCSCLTSYIAAESYCYQKIDPGQPGCVYNEQCSAVWPDAYCDTSAGVGTCRCGENKVERVTRDGHVCLDMLDGNQNILAITCPLPEGAGYTSALSDSHHPRQSNSAGPVLCNTDSGYIADIYDCVGFVSSVDLTSSGYSDKANGICCPNRGMCQQFLWDPTAVGQGEHSPNNFKTIEHCESYCRDGCTRGAPEYESRMSFHEETPITGCSQSTTCSNNYECKSVGSSQWCCPSVASVCGPIGGRPLDTSIYSRGSVYHNGVEKQCSVTAGTHSGSVMSPNRVSRTATVLHLMSAELINQSVVLECVSDLAWGYDSGSKTEIKLLNIGNNFRDDLHPAATGCQGNDNNFETLVDCQTFCRNASRESEMECESFEYLGCDGNSNNFATRQECEGYCGVGAYICALPPQQGSSLCSGGVYSVTRYYFNIVTKKCSPFAFNGCDGNPNNFASLNQCNNFCTASGSIFATDLGVYTGRGHRISHGFSYTII